MERRAPRRGPQRLGRGAGRGARRRADRVGDGAPGRLNAPARRIGAWAAALAGAALGACATSGAPAPDDVPGAAPTPAAVAALDARRAALDDFAVGGALGYWTDDENVSARIDWHESGGARRILLVGPLGLGNLLLADGPDGATLARGGAVPVRGASADALLRDVLGLEAPIPLGAVRDWLRGLPGPDATDVRRDAAGRLETLLWTDASGARWFARVRRWTEADGAGGLELPALLTARSGERRLRLALSDWRVEPPGARPADPAGGRLAIPGR